MEQYRLTEDAGDVAHSWPVPWWRLTALFFQYELFRAFENSPWTSFWKACHLHFLRRKTLIYPAWKRAKLRNRREA